MAWLLVLLASAFEVAFALSMKASFGFTEDDAQRDRRDHRNRECANVFGPILMTQAMLPLLRRSTAARVVNLSSSLGSFAIVTDPASPFYDHNLLAYNASKAALNATTVALAKELRRTSIMVNAVDPGYTATDLNEHQGTRTVEEGARAAVRLALLGPDGPTGQFFDEEGTVSW